MRNVEGALRFTSRTRWRNWLEKNHAAKSEALLVIYKRPYFYGPYSEGLTDVIETMVGSGLLIEEPLEIGPRIVKYVYRLSDKGEALYRKIDPLLDKIGLKEKVESASRKLSFVPTPELVAMSKRIPVYALTR